MQASKLRERLSYCNNILGLVEKYGVVMSIVKSSQLDWQIRRFSLPSYTSLSRPPRDQIIE